jgi:hypothetical protein
MTQDEIILIADASGISFYGMGADRAKFIYYLKAFAKLVEDKEREACAKVCDDIHAECEAKDSFSSYAEAIRARGEA